MNQFVVPQFIDVEAKLIGPVTARQFVITLIGGFILVGAWKLADTMLFIIIFLFVGGGVFVFGFLKVQGRPFHYFLFNVFDTLKKPNIRVWKAIPASYENPVIEKDTTSTDDIPGMPASKQLTRSRLTQLSLVVDTGGVYRTEDEDEE